MCPCKTQLRIIHNLHNICIPVLHSSALLGQLCTLHGFYPSTFQASCSKHDLKSLSDAFTGPERSGSTWLFNAVRLLLKHAEIPYDPYWITNLSQLKLRQRKSARCSDCHSTKTTFGLALGLAFSELLKTCCGVWYRHTVCTGQMGCHKDTLLERQMGAQSGRPHFPHSQRVVRGCCII